MILLLLLLLFGDDLSSQLPKIKRVYVDRLTGGETAAQMRDLIITALENSKLFVLTENQERADAILRGAAEDLIYTDQFKSSENVSMRGNSSDSEGSPPFIRLAFARHFLSQGEGWHTIGRKLLTSPHSNHPRGRINR